ncbi:MAG: thrombospondin type 3 repeat-containing protein, partial [Deltaproteobacteria bacterium]|nr:thrombospondin type 3 repeat-containing protein [Deltaproteobacteria bacterium]
MRNLERKAPVLGAVFAATLVAAPHAAAGDPVPSAELRGWSPALDPHSGLHFEPASSPDTFDWNTALWLSYAYQPVTLRDPATDETVFAVVEHQLTGDLTFNMGFAERLSIGVDLPFALFQAGDDPTEDAIRTLGTEFDSGVPGQAFGDLKLAAKLTIVQPTNQEFGGFALALHDRFGIPTGDEASFLGEGHVSNETRLLAEYRYVAIAVHGALGVKFRDSEEFGCAGLAPVAPSAEPPECATTFGHEIPWSAALSFWPQALGIEEGRMIWFVEAFGHVPMYPQEPFTNASVSQAQLAAGARFHFDDFSILAAADWALAGGIGNPAVRGTLSVGWAPRTHDADEDGVLDENDRCPDLLEDHDGHEDDDGCPDWDNDDDGVPDEEDRCPGEQEDEDFFEDEDGCADPDNDRDGIADGLDACPEVPGVPSSDANQRGCPDLDPDGDGVPIDRDQCAGQAEDVDGFEDADGCPDPDNDHDGIHDGVDACRNEKGVANDDPKQNGCPDADGDGIADRADACPTKPGERSDDPDAHGCPEGERREPTPPAP